LSAQFGVPAAEAAGVVRAIEHPVNLLSAIFAQLYSHLSNGLKEMLSFLGSMVRTRCVGPRSVGCQFRRFGSPTIHPNCSPQSSGLRGTGPG
jgi:hypothetical protein